MKRQLAVATALLPCAILLFSFNAPAYAQTAGITKATTPNSPIPASLQACLSAAVDALLKSNSAPLPAAPSGWNPEPWAQHIRDANQNTYTLSYLKCLAWEVNRLSAGAAASCPADLRANGKC